MNVDWIASLPAPVRRVIYFSSQRAIGSRIGSVWREFLAWERFTPEQLNSAVDEKLRGVLESAIHSSEYYRALNIPRRPNETAVEWLRRFPVLSRAQVREHFVRIVQKTVEAAVRDYDEISRTHRVRARITAHNLLSKERIAGTFAVVGSLDAETLLFVDSSGSLHTLGREYRAEYAAEEVVCFAADSARTVIRRVDLGGRTPGMLRGLYPPSADPRFFGHLTLFEPPGSHGSRDTPPVAMGNSFLPVSITGTTLSLHFAGLRELKGFEDLPVSDGSLLVRLMLPPQSSVDSTVISSQRIDPHVLTVGGDSVMIAVRVGEPVVVGQLLTAKPADRLKRESLWQRLSAQLCIS